jgi:hypothetical protein
VGVPSFRNPAGLLSLFGVKTGGRLPSWPDDALYAPVVDLLAWVMADPGAWEMVNNTTVAAAGVKGPVQPGSLLVPAGQTWAVLDFGLFSASVGSAAGLSVVPMAVWSPGAQPIFLGPESQPVSVIGEQAVTKMSREILIVPAGCQLGWYVTRNAQAAGTNVTASLRFCRLLS